MTKKIELSVLDPSPIVEGGSAELSLQNTLDLAKKTEQWGYKRFWLAEHHNWARNGEFSIPYRNWTSSLCHGKNAYWIWRNAAFPLFSSFRG